ncbi:hypothetical protein GALL_166100 [mine drainage metagenome]|uniref:PIN domain-containing protein n=1 Tax=mine drainage metagenome TaxID=410659 RepID=A0A1J5RZP7_9ZZZZ
MKLAITDACIFIDVYNLELTAHFFKLGIEIHTSYDVFNELYPHQKDGLASYLSSGKLTLHNLNNDDRVVMYTENYPLSLSDNDKTVLHLAGKIGAMVLSSDKNVRTYARKKAIEYHGMLWIFDRLVDTGLLDAATAAVKLNSLISTNSIYRNNKELVREMNIRLKEWC